MGNCFVKKLKESVNNDNLDKLGVFKFYIPASSSDIASFSAIENGVCTVRTVDGSNFGNVASNEVDITTSTLRLVPQTGGGWAEITNKYSLKRLYINYGAFLEDSKYIDVKKLSYMTNLQLLGLGIKGNLISLPNCPNMTEFLSIPHDSNQDAVYQISGDVAVFAKKFPTLTDLVINDNSMIFGAIEGFVAANVSASTPVTTRSMNKFRVGFSNVTWKDSTSKIRSTPAYTATLAWAPNAVNNSYIDITFLSETTTINVHSDGTWDYVNSDMSQYVG